MVVILGSHRLFLAIGWRRDGGLETVEAL